MAVRLSKIAREFNVGLSTIVEFLHSKGIKISSDPNAKLTDEDYALVAKEFSSDSQVKKESSLVDLKNTRKKKRDCHNRQRWQHLFRKRRYRRRGRGIHFD